MRRSLIFLLPIIAASCVTPEVKPIPSTKEARENVPLPIEIRLSADHYQLKGSETGVIPAAGPGASPTRTFNTGIELSATVPCPICGGSRRSDRVVVWIPTRQWDYGLDAGIMDPRQICGEYNPPCERCQGKGAVAR